ncbi:hypothetical protein R1flu_003626 [Riccia fluitans]|uniref:NADH-plastoquinone oxidoreductase subunit K n=1 Tax=Riccia fluitans TaxID=41844 RepID=A0ABD1Y9I6_9MARC
MPPCFADPSDKQSKYVPEGISGMIYLALDYRAERNGAESGTERRGSDTIPFRFDHIYSSAQSWFRLEMVTVATVTTTLIEALKFR